MIVTFLRYLRLRLLAKKKQTSHWMKLLLRTSPLRCVITQLLLGQRRLCSRTDGWLDDKVPWPSTPPTLPPQIQFSWLLYHPMHHTMCSGRSSSVLLSIQLLKEGAPCLLSPWLQCQCRSSESSAAPGKFITSITFKSLPPTSHGAPAVTRGCGYKGLLLHRLRCDSSFSRATFAIKIKRLERLIRQETPLRSLFTHFLCLGSPPFGAVWPTIVWRHQQ